jgi:hypothetical protein
MRRPLSPGQRLRLEGLVREKEERCGLCGSTGLWCDEDAASFIGGGFNVRVLCTNTGAEVHAGGFGLARDHSVTPSKVRRPGLLAPIHRSAWKGGSPKFVRTGSSEVAQWARAGRLDRDRANWHRVREFGAEGGRRAETTHLWSFRFTTPAFRFRAVLTGDGSEEVELAKA